MYICFTSVLLKFNVPSAVGGTVDQRTPVTCAATLGSGTPRIPELRTGSTPVSLSVETQADQKHTDTGHFLVEKVIL